MIDLARERFYATKTQPILRTRVIDSQPAGDFEWQLVQITRGGGRDVYQVFVDTRAGGRRDALNTVAGASAYARYIAGLNRPAAPLGAEQTNTTLVVGGELLKVYRRLEPGPNPDVELQRALAGCPHIADVTGHVTRGGYTLAMLQKRIDGTDGFTLATQGNLTCDDARELGAAIKRVHEGLAAPVQRIHGDLHLGQTIWSKRWYLVDFEGEPARSLAERRRPDHPMRDLAGMVRSFDYARAVGGFDRAWERERVQALLAGYGAHDPDLLREYEVEKARYEVRYELDHRPEWAHIPLAALERLTQ